MSGKTQKRNDQLARLERRDSRFSTSSNGPRGRHICPECYTDCKSDKEYKEHFREKHGRKR